MQKKYKLWAFIAFVTLALLYFGTRLAPLFLDYITKLQNNEYKQQLLSRLDSIGPIAIPILFVFQMLQIVIAVLPGGLVEVFSGMLLGPIWGTIISICGIMAGTFVAFVLAQKLGRPFIRRMVSEQAFDRYVKLCNNKRMQAFILFLFFLPGIPKDVLIYAIGSGTRSLSMGIRVSIIRIPSILVSVYAGSLFGEGDFVNSILLYSAFLIVGLLGMAVNSYFLKRMDA